jgi:raffinose/stachyose/melibiose transport system permease protein
LTADPAWVGWKNYIWAFTNPNVLNAGKNTLIFGLITVCAQMGCGFLLAVSLAGPGRLRQWLRVLYFIPVVLTPTVIGFLFSQILEVNGGELVSFLRSVGLGQWAHPWLGDPKTALYAVCVVNIWLWTGFAMAIYQSAITSVPKEIIEAARIDGANSFQLVVHILLPFLRPTHWSLLTLSVIGTLKTFDIPYVLTRGGPGGASDLLTTLLFRTGFEEYEQGRAAVIGTLLFVVALTLTIIQLRLAGREKR